mmetsp:Transcript_25423/g.60586  ORF Transcript_25423/g.60586 Transcript_25423/m.60586 type:complete len:82 (-) Transcript_25423:1226-1471(-)
MPKGCWCRCQHAGMIIATCNGNSEHRAVFMTVLMKKSIQREVVGLCFIDDSLPHHTELSHLSCVRASNGSDLGFQFKTLRL